MEQDLVNDLLIFDTAVRRIGDYLYGTPTVSAGFKSMVNILFNRPPKGPNFGLPRSWCAALNWRFVLNTDFSTALDPSGWCD
jgi:hypothetical protein